MIEEKKVILELGKNPFNALFISKIAQRFLNMFGNDWTLRKTHQWEIEIDNNDRCDFRIIERDIKLELDRLALIYWDLETLGLIKKEKEIEEK